VTVEGISVTVPAAPTDVTATADNTSAGVSWTAPANGGSVIIDYIITPYLSGVAQSPITTGSTTTSYTVTGLTNGDSYTFTVEATNTIGTGDASSQSNAVTPAVYVADVPSSYLAQIAAEPTFYDNFAGTTLNTTNWNSTYLGMGAGNVGLKSTSAADVTVDNGVTLTLSSDTVGACIDTYTKFTFNQGYIQGIMTLPVASDGDVANWGGLYTASTAETANVNDEIDVNETLNLNGSASGSEHAQPRTSVHSTVDRSYDLIYTASPSQSNGVNYAGVQHTYGALWDGDTVTFIYDGVVVGSTTQSAAGGSQQHSIFLCEGQDEAYGGVTEIGESIHVAQVAYWPLAG
jgi:Fibronectin type III domain/Glycosyl hydrolases family 16